jgi:hypothetical protein
MTYTKPEVVKLPNPISAVQGSGRKPSTALFDAQCYEEQTISAYEADE